VYRYNISYPPGFGICLKVVIFQEKSRFVPRPYVLGLDILCDLVTGKRLLPLVLLVPWSTSGPVEFCGRDIPSWVLIQEWQRHGETQLGLFSPQEQLSLDSRFWEQAGPTATIQ
jgi:hypothetical protein